MDKPFTYQERINQQRAGFSRSYNRLADFLLDSYLQAALMTAHELAQALDLDPATVVRFSQSLGYRGYPELQHELRDRVRLQFLPRSQPPDFTSTFDQTSQALSLTRANLSLASLDELVEKLASAPHIWLACDPAGQWLTGRLALQLIAAGFPACSPAVDSLSLAACLTTAKTGDLLLAIDLLGESPHMERALALARQAGLTVVLVAGSASLPSALHADIPLIIYGADEPATRLACAAAIIQTVKLVLRQHFPERMDAAPERLAELVARIEGLD